MMTSSLVSIYIKHRSVHMCVRRLQEGEEEEGEKDDDDNDDEDDDIVL